LIDNDCQGELSYRGEGFIKDSGNDEAFLGNKTGYMKIYGMNEAVFRFLSLEE
jgi:hypothetical protein